MLAEAGVDGVSHPQAEPIATDPRSPGWTGCRRRPATVRGLHWLSAEPVGIGDKRVIRRYWLHKVTDRFGSGRLRGRPGNGARLR